MYEITIEKMIHGGYGLGHLASGEVVMVTGALPQERLTITIQQRKKNFSLAEITKIISPSPYRCSPKCRWQECGGCDLHHANYQGQLASKEAVLDDLLQRFGLQSTIEPFRHPILGASQQYHYRQRIRLQCDGRRIGFRVAGSHRLVEVDKCLLAPEEINIALQGLRQAKESATLFPNTRQIEFWLNPVEGDVIVLFHFSRPPRPADMRMAQSLIAYTEKISRIFFTGENFALIGAYPEADKTLAYKYHQLGKILSPLHYTFEIGGFSQLHLAQNRLLIETVLQLAGDTKSVLDLYCGMGNFSIPLSITGAEVFGIEGQGVAVRSARYNAERNVGADNVVNAVFQKSPVHTACRQLAQERKSFDTVIIDPPRSGIYGNSQLASDLRQLTQKKMIYISCDPASLMRDITILQKKGFSVAYFQPIDMFPQTHHIETVVHFIRQDYE